MNRFVSLLLVALSLAAVSLAQPAQAQWVKGRTYYPAGNSAPTLHGATTISMTPIGTVALKSSPQGYPDTADGSFSGNVSQEYNWMADSTPDIGFSCNDGYAVSGSCTGPGSANSTTTSSGSQTGGAMGTTVGTPDNSYFSGSTVQSTYIPPNNAPKLVTRSASLGVNTSEYYTGTATASAAVTLGAPIGQQ